MNLSVPLGFAAGLMVLYYGVFTDVDNARVFISMHAAVIVLGGTAAAAMICFPLKYFFSITKIMFHAVLGVRHAATITTINEIVSISIAMNGGRNLNDLISKTKNPFLRESLQLMETGGLSDEELFEVLEKRVEFQNEKYQRDSSTFRIVGKFPPAFGLIGTSVGMIALLQGLAEPDAFNRIGPTMSLALVATFYGLVLSNFILIPIGENLNQACEDDLILRRIVVDGIRLIKYGKHPLLVGEHLKSYLAPAQRNQMKKVA